MTGDITWVVNKDRRRWQVRGFTERKRAREHTEKHFLDTGQQWDQAKPARRPAHYRAQLRLLDRVGQLALLDEVARDYVETVSRHTSAPELISGIAVGTYRSKDGPKYQYPSLDVVSEVGIYSSFQLFDRELSELRTSFRPRPRVERGNLYPRHFRDEALRRLDRVRP